ncbi:acyl-CoA--6-aminopenicillanic acid acyltransferase [Inquilinus limosus]|uniref:C45 family autoproteolytic acyltransferase/hydolase n=1 Tax=Inquilinus limosus TaxID=171674 RepID=UPI003F172EC1
MTPFPFVDIHGTPRERGRQYGAAAADRTRKSVEVYARQLRDLGYDWAQIRGFVADFVPKMEDFAPELIEEMRGIAEGAELEFESVALINCRTEVMQLAHRRKGLVEGDPDGCTGAVILGSASADGQLIHGQNWDWRAECAETAIVLRVRREDGPDVLTFTEAGGLARNGLNSVGTAITANYLESDRDYRLGVGVPLPLIRRKALEQEHFALSMRTVVVTPKSASNNMILSNAGGFAIDFECAPDETFPLYPEDGLLVHANHWRSPVALAKLKEVGIPSSPESYYRDWRVQQHLQAKRGQLTAEDMKAAFFDDFGAPYAVCRPPRPSQRNNLSATVAMVIMRPAEGTMEVAPLPALNRTFTTYSLDLSRRTKNAA